MDAETANALFGFPKYNLVQTKDGGAKYREICISDPLLACYQWKPPHGNSWKAKHGASSSSRFPPPGLGGACEDDYDDGDDDYEASDDGHGDYDDTKISRSGGAGDKAVGSRSVRPGCFWEEEVENDRNERRQENDRNERKPENTYLVKFDRVSNLWCASVPFHASLIGLLYGKKRKNLQQLQNETDTKITVPENDDRGGTGQSEKVFVSISSSVSRECVKKAVDRVMEIASVSTRSKSNDDRERQPENRSTRVSPQQQHAGGAFTQPSSPMVANHRQQIDNHRQPNRAVRHRFTHFVNLPINEESFHQQFKNFKFQVLRDSNTYSVAENMFTEASRLHLTLFLLNLDTPDKIGLCRSIIAQSQAAIYDAVGSRTVMREFKGIDVMNEDTTSATVIYTAPVRTDKHCNINSLTQVIANNLVNAGVTTWDELHSQRCLASDGATIDLKLHATLINTKRSPLRSVDATRIVSDFKFLNFGKVAFKEIHLSSLNEFERNGRFKCITQCKLP